MHYVVVCPSMYLQPCAFTLYQFGIAAYLQNHRIMFCLERGAIKLHYKHDQGNRPGIPSERIYPEHRGIQVTLTRGRGVPPERSMERGIGLIQIDTRRSPLNTKLTCRHRNAQHFVLQQGAVRAVSRARAGRGERRPRFATGGPACGARTPP